MGEHGSGQVFYAHISPDFCIFSLHFIASWKTNIPGNFLWEYDLETFNYDRSHKIVIERGNLEEWREILKYYGEQKILDTIEWSAQLNERGKRFSGFFLKSDFLNVT